MLKLRIILQISRQNAVIGIILNNNFLWDTSLHRFLNFLLFRDLKDAYVKIRLFIIPI